MEGASRKPPRKPTFPVTEPTSSPKQSLPEQKAKVLNKKKIRRGVRKGRKNTVNSNDEWSLYLTNIRNLDTKQSSLEAILANKVYSLVIVNETHFQSGRKVQLPGYITYTRNRSDKNAGGISTSVKDIDAPSSVRVEEGRDENEYIVTRHSQFEPPINVINVYGQQEARMSKESVEKHWKELLEEISKIEARNELLVLCGDFNRHLGSIVPLNSPKVSYGGELVVNFIETKEYILLNSSNKTSGGPWTREDPANNEYKSVLDLVIVSAELEKYVEKMVIDKDRRFTAF